MNAIKRELTHLKITLAANQACRPILDALSSEKRNVPRGTFSKMSQSRSGKGVPMSTQTPQNAKSRPRLGRGLSSLLSVSDLPVQAEVGPAPAVSTAGQPDVPPPQIGVQNEPTAIDRPPLTSGTMEIPVDQISPNPHQPRREMNQESLAELAASLKSTGLIQPIVVRKGQSGYQLIAGERRLRAAKMAGLKSIPAIIREVDAFAQAQMALIENIQREDLNPLDRASAYRALLSQLGLTQAELANRLGENRAVIAHYLRLLDLAEPVRELIRSGKLSLGHAKLLASVNDILEQQRLADLCIAQDLSVRNLERLQSGVQNEPTATRDPSISPHLLDLEKTIARQIGMRVQVRSNKKGKGRMVIHYANLDQFDDLMKRLGVKVE